MAIGLAGDPELFFLDEPTTGLDPAARRGAWEMVGNLRSLGKTVVLTTHYMDEAEQLADRVAIIVQGEIVAEGTPGELVHREGSTIIRFKVRPGAGSPPEDLGAETAGGDGRYTITTGTPTPSLHRLTGWAMERAIELEDLSVSTPTLEDVFIELVGAFERGGEAE